MHPAECVMCVEKKQYLTGYQCSLTVSCGFVAVARHRQPKQEQTRPELHYCVVNAISIGCQCPETTH